MGTGSSSLSDLSKNELLCQFAGHQVISENDPFWNQLLSFSFNPPSCSSDHRLLEESTSNLCKNLQQNNLKTANFTSLVRVFLMRATELKASVASNNNVFTWQTYNALFIIRRVCKHFVENMCEETLLRQFTPKESPQEPPLVADDLLSTSPPPRDTGILLEELMAVLVEILVDIPVVSFTYVLHVECIHTLLVLLSVQLFLQKPSSKSSIFRFLMAGKCSVHACRLTSRLLENFAKQEKCPDYLRKREPGGSFVLDMAAGLWSRLTARSGGGQPANACHHVLASQSLLLLLVIINHCTASKVANPYRQALLSFDDSNSKDVLRPSESEQRTTATADDSAATVKATSSFALNYAQVYEAIYATLQSDESTLLLYLLLHQNQHLKNYVLSRTDLENLILPILRVLYTAQERNSHHIYMALIILLILSEDQVFCKAVHEIQVNELDWYTERNINAISLGGLLILVVIRTIQYNMLKMRDKYLHTNCLAALANMSARFENIHPYVAQKILSLFELLAKKQQKILQQMRKSSSEQSASNGESEDTDSNTDQLFILSQDLHIVEEVIRMVLEILNSALCNNLQHNPNLVYTLLHKKQLFEMWRSHPSFQELLHNINMTIEYFCQKLEACKQPSPEQVLETITEASRQWKSDRLKKFPELKFKYVEEEQPEEFFVPYVWSLVYHSSNLYWNENISHIFATTTNIC